ncbi:cysteine peptidase 2 family C54 protein-like protein [Leptotrombidium deliense]|uniref:Cysteine protease n=1 Tax=Leptotrombidium deliense TaxID=299467 RepID=A0A443SQB0_9ACAR|nr:cysteine peptidase 2 family C54 protein-like protein [Leptotrombidium deliense]
MRFKVRIWFLGENYNSDKQIEEFYSDVRSRLWMTYRKDFEPIHGIAPTTDKGWGCMLRCGQMVLAQTLISKHLGRDWRWSRNCDDKVYQSILKMFHDNINSFYSIHRMAQMGAVDGIPVRSHFTPNDVAQILKDLSIDDRWNNLHIHVALDNIVCVKDIKDIFSNKESNDKSDDKKSVLLFIPLRIGLSKADPVYFQSLKCTFEMKQSVGIIGGRPHRGLYFVGYTDNQLLYFDPHKTQQTVNLSKFDDVSYHQEKLYQMNINHIDPSIALCFHFESNISFDDWCCSVSKNFVVNQKQPLFELSETGVHRQTVQELAAEKQILDYDYI